MNGQRNYLIGFIIILMVAFVLTIGINSIQSIYQFKFFEMFGIINIIFYTYILFNIDKLKN